MARVFKTSAVNTFGNRYLPKNQIEALEYGCNKIMQTDELDSVKLAGIGGISYGHFRNIINRKFLFKKKHFYNLIDYYHMLPWDYSDAFIYIKDIDENRKQLMLIIFTDDRIKSTEYEEVVLSTGFGLTLEEIKKLNPLNIEDECINIFRDKAYSDYEDPMQAIYEQESYSVTDFLKYYALPIREIVKELDGEDERVLEEYLEVIKSLKKLREAGKEKK